MDEPAGLQGLGIAVPAAQAPVGRLERLDQQAGIARALKDDDAEGLLQAVEKGRELPDRRLGSLGRRGGRSAIDDARLDRQVAGCLQRRQRGGGEEGLGAKAMGDVDDQRPVLRHVQGLEEDGELIAQAVGIGAFGE